MGTHQTMVEMGITAGTVVRTPDTENGETLAVVRRPYFTYVMVQYPSGKTIGYVPRLLRRATGDEEIQYRRMARIEE